MATGMDPSVIKRTSDTLGKVIAKPPLTEKLLSRPPFKYLHDIVFQVDKASGFFKGLYSIQERDSKNIQDKDQKIQFLQKAINTLSFTLGELVPVKPSKIVAGHEADRTNEFLQLLASAVLRKLDSSEAVKRVKRGEDPAQELAKPKEKEEAKEAKSKEEKKHHPRVEKIKAAEGEGTSKRSQSKERSSSKDRSSSKERSQSKDRSSSKERSQSKERGERSSAGDGRKHHSKEKSEAKPHSKERRKERDEKSRTEDKKHSGSEDKKHSGSDTSKSRDKEPTKDEDKVVKEDEAGARPSNKSSRKRQSVSTAGSSKPEEGPPTAGATALGGGGSGSDNADDEGLGSETKLDRPSSARGSRKRRGTRPSPAEAAQESAPPQEEQQQQQQQQQQQKQRQHHQQHRKPPSGAAERADIEIKPVARSPSPPLVTSALRPGSARPAPPRIVTGKKSAEEANRGIQPSMPPSVIMDTPAGVGGPGDEEEDDDQFVVADSTPLTLPTEDAFTKPSDGIMDEKPEGALTKNIVAMKEHLEGGLNKESSETKVYLPAISEAQRKKERELVSKEIEKLQTSIQTLCKSANPLGKIMDYVQEDIDSMQKELEMWELENRKHAEAVQREQSVTELELQPLRAQLEELEAKIVEQVDVMSATKANILKNDVKIQQMLNSMTFAAS